MRRREFISGVTGAAAWPLVARAQHPGMPVIGLMDSSSPEKAEPFVADFREGLTAFLEKRKPQWCRQ